MKKYLIRLTVFSLILWNLSAFAETESKEDLALKRKAERELLIKKTEEAWAKSEKSKLKQFISPSVTDPLKKKYYEAVLQRLSEVGNKYYPKEIIDLNEPQTVIVSFELGRAGNLIKARVVQPSKHKIINDYMLKVLELGQPFPGYFAGAFPDTVESVVITKGIKFNKGSAKIEATISSKTASRLWLGRRVNAPPLTKALMDKFLHAFDLETTTL